MVTRRVTWVIHGGYKDDSGVHHLNVLDFQRQIRTCPKTGCRDGGWLLHRWRLRPAHDVGDLTIAGLIIAIFGQTGPKVGSSRPAAGGASYMAASLDRKSAWNLVPVASVRRETRGAGLWVW